MNIEATVRIGKGGITDGVLNEIKEQLKKRKVVKIKFLKNAEREDMLSKAEEIASFTGGKIIDVRGFTITIEKK